MEAGLLSEGSFVQKVSGTLRAPAEQRRDQLHFPGARLGFHAQWLARSGAGKFCVRLQSSPEADAHHADEKERHRSFYRRLSEIDRTSSRRPPPRTSAIPVPAEFQKLDIARLEAFLPLLPADIRYTFEFRNDSWLDDAVFTRLAERNIALCLAESERLEIPKVFTADFTYFRLRKAEYDQAARDAILEQVNGVRSTGRDVSLYFKHEDDPQGASWADELVLRAQ